jgi:hypothetical protein
MVVDKAEEIFGRALKAKTEEKKVHRRKFAVFERLRLTIHALK